MELITSGVLRLRATLRVLILGLLRLRGKGHSKSKTLTQRTLAPRSAQPWIDAVAYDYKCIPECKYQNYRITELQTVTA